MAEFKLGRIKLVWKGTWVTATAYVKDDVVRYAGKTYICVIGHTSAANFNTDLDIVPSKWNLVSDGQRWMGEWTVSTSYEEGDLVKYGGNIYVCIDAHTSAATITLGLENNNSDWETFVEGIDWKGDWTVSTRYKNNDLVQYGGINYICTAYHTSAATTILGLEANSADWQEFSNGIEYKGLWVTATRYKLNDLVKYGAAIWICTAHHTAGADFAGDSANWQLFIEGFEFESNWNSATAYQPGDVVRYGGHQYVAKTQHTAAAATDTPLTETADWDLFTEGLKYQSNWTVATAYKIGEVVKLNGYVYVAVTDVPVYTAAITASTNSTKYFTASNTVDMVANMAIHFTGSTFGNVFTTGTYYIKQVVNSTTFTISTQPGGPVFTPTTATGSMTATFSFKPPNATYWTSLANGVNWRGEWNDDTEYVLGDLARYNSNVYICKLAHRSEGDDGSTIGGTGGGELSSRPDLDTSGTYWSIFNLGSLSSVMTTIGDMIYYGANGPARLPIGIEGQVLRVSSTGIPEWVSWGAVDHVYYVSPQGTDLPYPEHGSTLDKPWKTIRYACEQIEKGPRNPNAQRLLELNRVFIQREVSEWIDYQVTNNIAPFTTSFVYAQDRCERDTGWVIDALIYDIGHGGNVRTRGAALAYVNGLTEHNEVSPYTQLSAESDEDIAAYNYMLEIIEAVLNNDAPAANYQVLNGDNSTAVVSQYIDTNYTSESTVLSEITDLVGIITQALADENDTNIPARYAPNNTINVKTGQYREVLPIIVPESTVVLGDEVRSTNAGPIGSIIEAEDAKYSIGALGRLETVLGQIVVGSNVTESSGNTANQSIQFPLAQSAQSTLVKRLARTAQHRIDFLTNQTNMISYTLPTGYNTSFLSGYGDARKLLLENKEFVKEEIAAFVDTNYSSVKYSRTICKRDVGYIVDAIIYDLTYGGSTQTLNAGLAYFDGPGSTLLIDSSESAATIAAYNRLKTVIQQIIANTLVTASTGNNAVQWRDTTNLTGGSAANAFVGANIDIITAILTAASTTGRPNITVTTITGTDTLATASAHGLAAGDLVIPRTTANGVTADVRYYVLSSGLTATQFKLSTSYAGSAATLTNGSGLTLVFDTEDRPTVTNGVTTTTALITAYTTLSAAVGTIVTNMSTFIASNYPSITYNSAKCQRDARIILDAVSYDFMFNANFQTVKAAYAYLRASANDVFDDGTKAATRAAFSYVKDQAKSNVGGDATAQTRIESLMTTLDDIIFGARTEGSTCSQAEANTDYAILQIERNRDYIVDEIEAYITSTYSATVTATNSTGNLLTISDTSWLQRNASVRFTGTVFGNLVTNTTYYIQNIVSSTTFTVSATKNSTTALGVNTASGSMTMSLYYNTALCLRDIHSYLDAFKYDLKFTGNYKTCLAARIYSNAVIGSLEEDMYYVRDGTGIRNQTLDGLTGDLLAPNSYGTSRVSAGAYVSLDPGYGPDDYHAWIVTRSPYVQNVTTFGYAAIGQKIDGDLHNGGNKSIVSNDFTQVISDGIGAWVTNNARAELVSVFTYYSHIGYLAENGGRIRGTNGNNSYGDFGSVAEGFDNTETPITGLVDNDSYVATVGEVFTDGTDEILQFEFDNAGQEYTSATWSINGAGASASASQDEFRDGGVFQVRLLDNVDDSASAPEALGNFGGFGYVSNANTAQGGTTTQITIAAVDDEISAAYVGMKVYLTGGAGAGQYGIIATYNSGTKIATVNKESTGAAGWDHVVPGTTISAPDASTTYVIEPRASFTSPSFASTTRTLATSLTYVDAAYAATSKVYSPLSPTGGTGSGCTVTVVRKGVKYSAVSLINAGTNYTRLDTLTIAGTSLGGTSTTNDITITITSVNSTTGAIQNFEYTGVGSGGNFVALASSTQTLNTSSNGTTWVERATVLPSAATWTSLAVGDLVTVEVAGSFVTGRSYVITSLGNTVFTSIGAASNLVGTYFVATGAGSGTGTATPIAKHLVAVASGGTTNAYSTDGGLTWTAGGALPSSGTWTAVTYGNGRWVAVRSGSTASAYSTNGGISWTAGGALPANTTWQALVYGKNKFVAVATGGTQAAYSTDGGVTWTSATLPSSTNWNSVTYGNNRFVAISNASNTIAAYSLDGITWTLSTLPATANWTGIRYGQGVFLAVSQTTQAATSEDGIVWTSRTMSTAANGYSLAVHGNPNQTGIWAAVQRSTAGTVASSVTFGATAKARVYVQDNKIFAIRIVEPGSGYTVAPTLTITDPSEIYLAPTTVRIANGVLANPTFNNRGTGYASATANIDTGDGYANNFQSGNFIGMKRLTGTPTAGANIVFATQPNTVYKLVQVLSLAGTNDGAIRAFFQISPEMSAFNSPANGTVITTRIRYSQVRLTGHDFLDIGTGNFVESNYPNAPTQTPTQVNETADLNGGRVFYTSTDQDGNFRVGELFTIEQSTGVATLNADAFNIAGLSELTLGEITLGGTSATIVEFSTDPFFTANSDSIVPTQRAIKSYIAAQIGGGGASLNVNSIVAGFVSIAGTTITTTTGGTINMQANFNFQAGVRGLPIAWNYFLT